MFGFTIPTRLQKRGILEDGFVIYESNDTLSLVHAKLIESNNPKVYEIRVAKNRPDSYYTPGLTFKLTVEFHKDFLEELERSLSIAPQQFCRW